MNTNWYWVSGLIALALLTSLLASVNTTTPASGDYSPAPARLRATLGTP